MSDVINLSTGEVIYRDPDVQDDSGGGGTVSGSPPTTQPPPPPKSDVIMVPEEGLDLSRESWRRYYPGRTGKVSTHKSALEYQGGVRVSQPTAAERFGGSKIYTGAKDEEFRIRRAAPVSTIPIQKGVKFSEKAYELYKRRETDIKEILKREAKEKEKERQKDYDFRMKLEGYDKRFPTEKEKEILQQSFAEPIYLKGGDVYKYKPQPVSEWDVKKPSIPAVIPTIGGFGVGLPPVTDVKGRAIELDVPIKKVASYIGGKWEKLEKAVAPYAGLIFKPEEIPPLIIKSIKEEQYAAKRAAELKKAAGVKVEETYITTPLGIGFGGGTPLPTTTVRDMETFEKGKFPEYIGSKAAGAVASIKRGEQFVYGAELGWRETATKHFPTAAAVYLGSAVVGAGLEAYTITKTLGGAAKALPSFGLSGKVAGLGLTGAWIGGTIGGVAQAESPVQAGYGLGRSLLYAEVTAAGLKSGSAAVKSYYKPKMVSAEWADVVDVTGKGGVSRASSRGLITYKIGKRKFVTSVVGELISKSPSKGGVISPVTATYAYDVFPLKKDVSIGTGMSLIKGGVLSVGAKGFKMAGAVTSKLLPVKGVPEVSESVIGISGTTLFESGGLKTFAFGKEIVERGQIDKFKVTQPILKAREVKPSEYAERLAEEGRFKLTYKSAKELKEGGIEGSFDDFIGYPDKKVVNGKVVYGEWKKTDKMPEMILPKKWKEGIKKRMITDRTGKTLYGNFGGGGAYEVKTVYEPQGKEGIAVHELKHYFQSLEAPLSSQYGGWESFMAATKKEGVVIDYNLGFGIEKEAVMSAVNWLEGGRKPFEITKLTTKVTTAEKARPLVVGYTKGILAEQIKYPTKQIPESPFGFGAVMEGPLVATGLKYFGVSLRQAGITPPYAGGFSINVPKVETVSLKAMGKKARVALLSFPEAEVKPVKPEVAGAFITPIGEDVVGKGVADIVLPKSKTAFLFPLGKKKDIVLDITPTKVSGVSRNVLIPSLGQPVRGVLRPEAINIVRAESILRGKGVVRPVVTPVSIARGVTISRLEPALRIEPVVRAESIVRAESVLRVQSVLRTRTVPKTGFIPDLFVPYKPPPPPPPVYDFGKAVSARPKGVTPVPSRLGAFVAYIKRKGKFMAISGPTTRAAALDIGAAKALKTLAATFKVEAVKGVVAKKIRTAGEFAKYRQAFRSFAIQKGKKVALMDTFIQKRGLRLSAKSEVSEIMMAKVAKKKGGGGWL